ncbi:hypothetical protein [Actinocrispum sp. NPDC049592]|uniref:hypothetical protein n=1 Tax=Actinocrispum sp. NPDC049592 TaxID=3154835 RepID=UPI003423603D
MTRRWIVGGCVAVAAALIVIWVVTSSSSESGYRDTVVGIAHDGLSAVRTTDLLVTADQDDRLVSTYRSTAIDDAETGLSDAIAQLDGADRPGPAANALYERLAPLLRTGMAGVTEASDAMSGGTADLGAARAKLRAAGDGLAEFVRSTR